MKARKRILWALAIVLLIGAAAYVFRAQLALALAKPLVTNRLSTNSMASLPDGLHVGVCGAGSPFPDELRGGPCTLVVAGKRMFVFDAGSSSVRNIGRMGFAHGRIDAIFLTHFHSDHIDGLGELMLQRWVSAQHVTPVPVYGPPGVENVVAGFMQAYSPDRQYRVAHHGEATVPNAGFGGAAHAFNTNGKGRTVVMKDADLEIIAFSVDHAPVDHAVGYRISYKGRTVVLSGDTKKSYAVQREAQGVDLLVHEAMSTPMVAIMEESAAKSGRANLKKIFADIVDYHTSPEEAAAIARDAMVRYLLLNHIAPPLPLPGMVTAFLGSAESIYRGPIRIGADGDFISLPAGTTSIDVTRRF